MLIFWIYLAKKNFSKINVIRINNILISIVISVKFNKTFYYVLPSYNKKYHKYSFGKFHLYQLIKKEKNCFFFLGPGDEKYKKEFLVTKDELNVYTNSELLRLYYYIKKFFYVFIN